jgi:cell division protein FtsB
VTELLELVRAIGLPLALLVVAVLALRRGETAATRAHIAALEGRIVSLERENATLREGFAALASKARAIRGG